MLNYVWLGLVIIGILTAAGSDIYDAATNRYRNGEEIEVQYAGPVYGKGVISISKEYFERFYGTKIESADTFRLSASRDSTRLSIVINNQSPSIWKTIATAAGNENMLQASIAGESNRNLFLLLPTTSLVRTRAVIDSVISYSSTAVTIAIGLIGVMAFWLGIMKLAEDSGLVQIIARALKPVMIRLFPEIPPDHPAIGAMIMNIAANMLGLNNAATPLGLKAMDELDKLNKHKGTASNAMVVFLAINTAGLTIIPATAIAVRAALGSKEPTVILMTSFFGAGLATIAGVLSAKLLQRLKAYQFNEKEDTAK
ncbi:MAG: nucleoside recognition domain-containing protein [Candidatus Kryptoniota bacterium]